jgi:hypothetical protein
VVFSATLAVALLVIGVLSFTGVTVRNGLVLLSVPSLTCTVTSVDVVAAGVGGRPEVRRGDEAQGAGAGVDRELGRIGATDDAVLSVWAGRSASVAVTVITAVVFSATPPWRCW